ncbi:hypothetical protein WMF18_15295 [Sorangium sp. So ce315]|uniref:hypothetical protein n=1 Tax=Sorangium sp. So ce315 TaxID=3133299 RepID=UPI003F6163F0
MIELDTGRRRDHLPAEAAEGVGFCRTDMRFEPSAAMLVVEGCIWACPYEFRFFDFSDPMSGWPEKPILQGAWISEEEQARRKAHEEARKRSP